LSQNSRNTLLHQFPCFSVETNKFPPTDKKIKYAMQASRPPSAGGTWRSLAGVASPASADLGGESGGGCWCCRHGQPVVSVGVQSVPGPPQEILFMGGAGNGVSAAQWKASRSLPPRFHLLAKKFFVYKCGFVIL